MSGLAGLGMPGFLSTPRRLMQQYLKRHAGADAETGRRASIQGGRKAPMPSIDELVAQLDPAVRAFLGPRAFPLRHGASGSL